MASLLARLDTLERERAALLAEVAALGQARITAHPLPGKWSILENVEHMVLAERNVLGDLSRAAEVPARPRRLRNRLAVQAVLFVLRYGVPVKVPDPAMEPLGGRSLGELTAMWEATHRELRAVLTTLPPGGAARIPFRHPIAGRVNVPEAMRMIVYHLRRHRRQIDRLIALTAP